MADSKTVDVEQLKAALTDSMGTYVGLGTDTFPTPQGPMVTQYRETMVMGAPFQTANPGGPGMSQNLLCVQYYTQLVNAQNGAPMHQETGFWMLSMETTLFMKAISIPRGIAILAGGTWSLDITTGLTMMAAAEAGSLTFGISNEPYLNQAAPTESFTTTMVNTSNSISYKEDSVLKIEGQTFNHTDEAALTLQS